MNIIAYIHRRYIPRLLRRLIEEYNLHLSVIEVRSSVIINERFLVSCSEFQFFFIFLLSQESMKNSGHKKLCEGMLFFMATCYVQNSGLKVLECWNRKRKEMVAIKIIKAIKNYRDVAMIEIVMLEQLGKYGKSRSR
jgi:hypothetical protein